MNNHQHKRFNLSKRDLIIIIIRIFIILFQIFGISLMIFLFSNDICNEKCIENNYYYIRLEPFYLIMFIGIIISMVSFTNELVYYYFTRKKSIVCIIFVFILSRTKMEIHFTLKIT